MSDSGDSLKYKWTPDSTTLLVSVWTDKQVQKQFEYATKPQLIWESVARYMKKKGYNVSAKQCRSRMKQVLVCYREAKRAGTRAGVEQYYECIDKVLKNRRSDQLNVNGVDTVDSTNIVKSPPKDVKTNKNLQMRFKYNEPIESLFRTEALSPTWAAARDEDYPDSPESNETVLAQPFRVLSPVRDAATNTRHQLDQITRKSLHSNAVPLMEPAVKDNFLPNSLSNNRFSEIPFQNTVQNVQNQIIQENMQQNQAYLQQNLLQNQLSGNNLLQMNPTYRQNLLNTNEALYAGQGVQWRTTNDQMQNQILLNQIQPENIYRTQNQFQQNAVNNQAIPQEPRKLSFRQNLGPGYQLIQNVRGPQNYVSNLIPNGALSSRYSPEYVANLDEAFCESAKDAKAHNLNETYDQPGNGVNIPNIDATMLTNNATFNDDTLSIEFVQDSPSPSDDGTAKVKDLAVNTDLVPNAPFRKKKAQKLEQLMLNAISSQSDVVNKILTAQNEMVTKFMDLDRDRQNRLENRLDHLLDVVQATVINKSSDKDSDVQEPIITNLLPPPKLGVIPPKLDLVPPKPCRFPSTFSPINNQNVELTRPGMISPPPRKIGSIWTKLGPVSQSPFVKAQQQLGFQTIANQESRTQSSAERRILQEIRMNMDMKTLIEETVTFIENEKHLQEKIENAKIQSNMSEVLEAKKRLFTNREPTAAMILSAAFIESETQYWELVENARINSGNNDITRLCLRYLHQIAEKDSDDILAGQGDGYERLRRLNIEEKFVDEPSDSSTPAKPSAPQYFEKVETRPTIQQLGQLVMQSSRWRENKVKPLEVNFPKKEENFGRNEFMNKDLRREEQRREEMRTRALRREELLREGKEIGNQFMLRNDYIFMRDGQVGERGDQFRERGDQFRERGDQFRERGDQFRERGDQFRERGDQFRERGDQFRGRDDQHKTREDENKVREDQYKTREDHYKTREDQYKMREDPYIRDKTKEDYKANNIQRMNIQPDGKSKALNWLQDRYSYGDQITKQSQPVERKFRQIGFSVDDLNLIEAVPMRERKEYFGRLGFNERNRRQNNVHFNDDMGPFGQLKQHYAQRYYTLQNQKQLAENDGALVPQNRDMINRYMREMDARRGKDDSDEEEFLDTTTTMSPALPGRRGSLTSDGTLKSGKGTCLIS